MGQRPLIGQQKKRQRQSVDLNAAGWDREAVYQRLYLDVDGF